MSGVTKGFSQREIFADCKSLDDVISAACYTKIRRRYKLHGMTKRRSTPIERIRELFDGGIDFNWSAKEEGFRR